MSKRNRAKLLGRVVQGSSTLEPWVAVVRTRDSRQFTCDSVRYADLPSQQIQPEERNKISQACSVRYTGNQSVEPSLRILGANRVGLLLQQLRCIALHEQHLAIVSEPLVPGCSAEALAVRRHLAAPAALPINCRPQCGASTTAMTPTSGSGEYT